MISSTRPGSIEKGTASGTCLAHRAVIDPVRHQINLRDCELSSESTSSKDQRREGMHPPAELRKEASHLFPLPQVAAPKTIGRFRRRKDDHRHMVRHELIGDGWENPANARYRRDRTFLSFADRFQLHHSEDDHLYLCEIDLQNLDFGTDSSKKLLRELIFQVGKVGAAVHWFVTPVGGLVVCSATLPLPDVCQREVKGQRRTWSGLSSLRTLVPAMASLPGNRPWRHPRLGHAARPKPKIGFLPGHGASSTRPRRRRHDHRQESRGACATYLDSEPIGEGKGGGAMGMFVLLRSNAPSEPGTPPTQRRRPPPRSDRNRFVRGARPQHACRPSFSRNSGWACVPAI